MILCPQKPVTKLKASSLRLSQGKIDSNFRLQLFSLCFHRARSLKRTREAALQFTIVARGLDGSSFGYSSVVT